MAQVKSKETKVGGSRVVFVKKANQWQVTTWEHGKQHQNWFPGKSDAEAFYAEELKHGRIKGSPET